MQTLTDCPEKLTDEQLDAYWEQGYLAFENALSAEEVEQARDGMRVMIERYAFQEDRATYRPPRETGAHHSGALFKGIDSPFMIQVEPGFTPSPDRLDELEMKVRKFMWFEDETPIYKSICTNHPRIQGVVQSILGAEVALYQSMALIKPPFIGSEKPWHQDNAYFSVGDLDRVLGTWIALDDVTPENGAMHFLPGAHREGPLKHYHGTDCEILPDRFSPADAVPVSLRAGGMIVFHGNAPHFTPQNTSARRRRALQFHYRSAANPIIERDAYDSIFVEADGTPATCVAAEKGI